MSVESNNELIKKFVESGKYDIRRDGHIYRKSDGVEIGYTKNSGYRAVSVVVRGGKKALQIHRIIWYVYGDKPLSTKLVLNHKDGNKLNNSIDNLEQVTQANNNLHTYRVLKHPPVIGNCKITQEQAVEIRRLHKEGWTYQMLMKKYKVGKTTISYVCNNKIWK